MPEDELGQAREQPPSIKRLEVFPPTSTLVPAPRADSSFQTEVDAGAAETAPVSVVNTPKEASAPTRAGPDAGGLGVTSPPPAPPAPPATGPALPGMTGEQPGDSMPSSVPPMPAPPPPETPLSDLCGQPGVLLCEDFEGEVSKYETFGNVIATEQRAYRGKRSLLADVTETGGQALLRGYFDAQSGATLFARGYYYIPSDSPLDTMTLFSYGSCAVIGMNNGLGMWCREGNRFIRGLFDIPRDEWFCLRWVYELGDNGAARAFIDDTPVVSLADVGTAPPAGVDWASFPASHSHPTQPPTAIFFDNLLVSNFEVGCD